jgi:biotin carboxylase
VHYDNLGTFEFLVDAGDVKREAPFAFIEANPRLQVEHTVTEEVTGIDLVKLQLKLAAGYSLAELGLLQENVPHPRGFAIQVRINMESMGADGVAKPSGGTITAFEMPSGPGLRTDTFGYAGYTTSPSLRFAAGEAHRAFADQRIRRRCRESLPGVVRVSHRGCLDQYRISAKPAETSGVRGERSLYALHR